ncbi:MAG: DMT family transporter [Kosmotogaceae bacterium]
MKKDSFFPYLAGIGSAVIFGFSFLFTKEALQVTRPIYFLAYRFTVAFVFISLLAVTRLIRINLRKTLFKELLPLILVQPLLYFTMEAMGVQRTTSGVAGLMISTIPVFVLILAHIFLGERLRFLQIISIFVALSGAIILTLSRGGEFGAEFLGIIFLFVSTFSAALYNILSRRASLKVRPIEITYFMMFAGFIGFNIIAIIQSLALKELNSYLTSFIHPQVLIWLCIWERCHQPWHFS